MGWMVRVSDRCGRFSTPVQTGAGATKPPIQWAIPAVKWLGCDFNHPPQPRAEDKEEIELYLYSPSVPLWQVIGVNLTCNLCCTLLRISKHDDITGLSEIQFVGFHVSINNPLHGAAPSEYSGDLGRPTNGHWQFDIPDLYIEKGDSVYYWLRFVAGSQSWLVPDLTWMAPGL